VLKFSDQSTETERSEQQGMMYLFAGAMLAIRNPRAHGIIKEGLNKSWMMRAGSESRRESRRRAA
jgi:hypothetical protein